MLVTGWGSPGGVRVRPEVGGGRAGYVRVTCQNGHVPSWGDLEHAAPELAVFGGKRLTSVPAYLATLRGAATPRVHPVSPIIGSGHLFVFMEPTSPKGFDLRDRIWYSLHNGVADTFGTGGEFWVSGQGTVIDDPELRGVAIAAATYRPEDRYVLFELGVSEARSNGYGDVPLPDPTRWVSLNPE